MCMCMCVCMHVCMYVCMYVCVFCGVCICVFCVFLHLYLCFCCCLYLHFGSGLKEGVLAFRCLWLPFSQALVYLYLWIVPVFLFTFVICICICKLCIRTCVFSDQLDWNAFVERLLAFRCLWLLSQQAALRQYDKIM